MGEKSEKRIVGLAVMVLALVMWPGCAIPMDPAPMDPAPTDPTPTDPTPTDPEEMSPSEPLSLADATQYARAALAVVGHARTALDLLGSIEAQDCGEARGSFLPRVMESIEADIDCATVALDTSDASRDVITLTLTPGCELGGIEVSGVAVLTYSGGDDRVELHADFRELIVDGYALDAEAGYARCADAERVWAAASGALGDAGAPTYSVELDVLMEPGGAFLSPTRWTVSGSGLVVDADAVVQVEVQQLVFEGPSPRGGTLILRVNDHVVVISFDRESGLLERRVSISIDGGEPQDAPIL